MDRTAYETMLDSMTGKWADLRELARDNHVAKTIIDARLHMAGRGVCTQQETDDLLLSAVLLLIHENEILRKKTLSMMSAQPTPFFVDRDRVRIG